VRVARARGGTAGAGPMRVGSGSGAVELAVFTSGASSGPVVVLVHGYPDTHQVWDEVSGALAPDFRVVTYDVRGAGASDAPDGLTGYHLDRLADDLFAVADAVSPDRPVHVVGHDWGSVQAWHAVTDPRAADRIASFTSISGPCLDHTAYWYRRRLASPSFAHLTEVARQSLKSWYITAFHLPLLAPMAWRHGLARRWGALLARGDGVVVRPGFPAATLADDAVRGLGLYRANIRPRMRNPERRLARVPVQLIVLSRDRYLSPALVSADLDQWAPRLTRRTLEASHWSALTRDAPKVAGWISEFASSAGRGLQELAGGLLRVSVPGHGHHLGRIDHRPAGLAFEPDRAVRADLYAGQLAILRRGQPDLSGLADHHDNRPVLADQGLEQLAQGLAGHPPSPPGTAGETEPEHARQAGAESAVRRVVSRI
jgi:pimeloyl-ACP methyl ester carboxylesterase